MAKYDPLHAFLRGLPSGVLEITLSFKGVEEILRARLPPSAYDHRAWWANPSTPRYCPYAQAWIAAGWEVDAVDQEVGWVTFRRVR